MKAGREAGTQRLSRELGDPRWLRIILGTVCATLVLCALTVYIVDPYGRYHKTPIVKPLYADEYRMLPGLLETADYDSLVGGTSLCLNFNLADVRSVLKWDKPLKIAARGCCPGTFKRFCDRAYANRKIKHVLASIEVFKLHELPTTHFLPLEPFLYRHSVLHECAYLFNVDVVLGATFGIVKAHADKNPRLNPDFMFVTDDGSGRTKYGKEPVTRIVRGKKNTEKASELSLMSLKEADRRMMSTFELCVLSTIRAHPETDFTFFFPPHSSWYWGFAIKDREFEALLSAKKHAIRELLALPNVKVYDFQTEADVVNNLDNYTDLVHYTPAINRRILEWIAADKDRCTPETVAANAEALRGIAQAAVAELP